MKVESVWKEEFRNSIKNSRELNRFFEGNEDDFKQSKSYPLFLPKAYAKKNPITGQHVELSVQPSNTNELDLRALKVHLKDNLPKHMNPNRINVETVPVGHRFKRN